MDYQDTIEQLSNYEHLATPVVRKNFFIRVLCGLFTRHNFECISWGWFRCKRCGHEEGI